MFVERLMQIVADARRIELRAGDIVNVGRLRAFKQTSAGRAAAPDRFECARQRQIERDVEILLNGNAVHDDRLIAAALGTHDVRVGREVLKHEEAMRVRRGRLRLGRRGGTHANVRERFFVTPSVTVPVIEPVVPAGADAPVKPTKRSAMTSAPQWKGRKVVIASCSSTLAPVRCSLHPGRSRTYDKKNQPASSDARSLC